MTWYLIHIADGGGRFYLAHPYLPRIGRDMRLRVISQHADAREAHRLAGELEQRRVAARWRRHGFEVGRFSSRPLRARRATETRSAMLPPGRSA
jgi:hypothetical protein